MAAANVGSAVVATAAATSPRAATPRIWTEWDISLVCSRFYSLWFAKTSIQNTTNKTNRVSFLYQIITAVYLFRNTASHLKIKQPNQITMPRGQITCCRSAHSTSVLDNAAYCPHASCRPSNYYLDAGAVVVGTLKRHRQRPNRRRPSTAQRPAMPSSATIDVLRCRRRRLCHRRLHCRWPMRWWSWLDEKETRFGLIHSKIMYEGCSVYLWPNNLRVLSEII